MTYLLCGWVLQCWNTSEHAALQNQRQRVDLEEPEPGYKKLEDKSKRQIGHIYLELMLI